ncbi:PCRF domain-containing protein, partial [Klebsiella pneumoniae]|nr:PCRF domain-containing protein [Klebsiella pneumoniae]
LRLLLVPRDPSDDKDVILEIKAGAGGDESALFAGNLLRMYLRYAERVGWKTEIIDATESELGGYKDVQVAVKTKGGN